MFSQSYIAFIMLFLTLNAHARVGYSSRHSVSVSLFDFGEGAVFRVETYINNSRCVLNVALF